ELLDAYSDAVIGAARTAAPAVVHLEAGSARRIAHHHDLSNESGVRVRDVEPGSLAAAAGIEVCDLIVMYDGEVVTGIDRLQRILDYRRVGRASAVTLLRRAEKITASVVAIERPG
ncbi:MAG: PDZ domain-containing protein, partial [Steroidobacteraceae bacterium]